ncbi:hypothetical protein CF326_g9123, partial [Tilletia indica]
VTVSIAPRPPGLRPRLVVIGPRRPDPPPQTSVEVEIPAASAPAADPAPASAPAPAAAPSQVAAPAPAAPAPAAPPLPSAVPSSSGPGHSRSVGAHVSAPGPSSASPVPPRTRGRQPPTREYQTRQHTSRLERARQQRESARTVLSMSDSFASAFRVQLSADGIELEPGTLKDAMRRTDWALWLQAMREEMESHSEMGTWVLEEVPEDRELVGSRWVFKLKLDSEGNVARYKARLVAQGFSQIPGVDYNETYSPVTRFVTIRTLLALAAFLGWHVHQLDVITAYLYGLLDKPVFMRQPPGFEVAGKEHLACRLVRALYGLKQSGREWYFTLRAALIDIGFEQSAADPAIFIFGSGVTATIVAIYVDDVLVLGGDINEIIAVKAALGERFKMTDQGQIGQFLGMKIERSEDTRSFFVSQSAYIRSMLARFNYSDIKSAPSPLDPKQRLKPYDGIASEEDRRRFQAILGCLLWLAQASRPDLAYAVATLARHASNPGPLHFGCIKRVIQYVAGTIDFRLHITADSSEDIVAYSDADFGGDHSAKSTSGWCVAVHGATVAWGSKLQSLVADSTAQAELIAVWQTAREVLALRHFFEDLGLREVNAGAPTVIYCDNQPAIHILANPVSNGLTRHMERKYLATREHQERGLVHVTYVNTRANPADMFTKALIPMTFHQHRSTIGLQSEQ